MKKVSSHVYTILYLGDAKIHISVNSGVFSKRILTTEYRIILIKFCINSNIHQSVRFSVGNEALHPGFHTDQLKPKCNVTLLATPDRLTSELHEVTGEFTEFASFSLDEVDMGK